MLSLSLYDLNQTEGSQQNKSGPGVHCWTGGTTSTSDRPALSQCHAGVVQWEMSQEKVSWLGETYKMWKFTLSLKCALTKLAVHVCLESSSQILNITSTQGSLSLRPVICPPHWMPWCLFLFELVSISDTGKQVSNDKGIYFSIICVTHTQYLHTR